MTTPRSVLLARWACAAFVVACWALLFYLAPIHPILSLSVLWVLMAPICDLLPENFR